MRVETGMEVLMGWYVGKALIPVGIFILVLIEMKYGCICG